MDFVAPLHLAGADAVPPLHLAGADAVPPLRRAFVVVVGDRRAVPAFSGYLALDTGRLWNLPVLSARAAIERAFGGDTAPSEDTIRLAIRAHTGAPLPAERGIAVCELPPLPFRRIGFHGRAVYAAAYLVGCTLPAGATPPPTVWSYESYAVTCDCGPRPPWLFDAAEFRNLRRYDALAVRVTSQAPPYTCVRTRVLGADPDLPVDAAFGGWQVLAKPLPAMLSFLPASAVDAKVRMEVVAADRGVRDVPYRRWKGLRRAFIEACAYRVLEP